MYPACLWSRAPGHDGCPHAPVLITTIGLAGQFWVQAEGASFDCSAILLCSAQTGNERFIRQSPPMAVGSEGRRRRSSSLALARRLSIAIMLGRGEAVGLAGKQHCPSYSGELVCECNGCDISMHSFLQIAHPPPHRMALTSRMCEHGAGPVDKQPPEVLIASFVALVPAPVGLALVEAPLQAGEDRSRTKPDPFQLANLRDDPGGSGSHSPAAEFER